MVRSVPRLLVRREREFGWLDARRSPTNFRFLPGELAGEREEDGMAARLACQTASPA
jgi:hypothetical protein